MNEDTVRIAKLQDLKELQNLQIDMEHTIEDEPYPDKLGKLGVEYILNNPEQEFAEEVIETKYSGIRMEIGFNIGYLLDVIGSIDSETLEISFFGEESSCLINEPKNLKEVYVIMPMRL